METNKIELQNLQEEGVKFSPNDLADKFLNLDTKFKDAIKKATQTLNAEYGDDSSNSTFEGLFSGEFLEMLNPETAHDEEDKKWRESQIKHISNLRQELMNSQDEETLNAAARELADHLINL